MIKRIKTSIRKAIKSYLNWCAKCDEAKNPCYLGKDNKELD